MLYASLILFFHTFFSYPFNGVTTLVCLNPFNSLYISCWKTCAQSSETRLESTLAFGGFLCIFRSRFLILVSSLLFLLFFYSSIVESRSVYNGLVMALHRITNDVMTQKSGLRYSHCQLILTFPL